MSENEYEIPIPYHGGVILSRHTSEEDFVDIQDLPSIPRWTSETRLLKQNRCARNNSMITSTSHNKRRNTSPCIAKTANLRRCTSSASYLANKIHTSRVSSNGSPMPSDLPNQSNSLRQPQRHHTSTGFTSSNTKRNILNKKNSFACVVSVENDVNHSNLFQEQSRKNSAQKRLGSVDEVPRSKPRADLVTHVPMRDRSKSAPHRGYHSTDSLLPSRVNLRDSAIDLVSDDDDSEAYTAVSLAGTLTGRNSVNPVKVAAANKPRNKNRKFYIIIAILCGVILLLCGLGVGLALALFS